MKYTHEFTHETNNSNKNLPTKMCKPQVDNGNSSSI